ncbi:MAG: PEP-CTERM sorting domain-containing protein [Planctomycetes bacterium]|nr:PEP-CTERM sorting domain-containing protein [Planctomycetota bacterium]
MKTQVLTATLSIGVFVALAATAQAQLILNPSFENTGGAVSQNGYPAPSELGTQNLAGSYWGEYAVPDWNRDARIWLATDAGPDGNDAFPAGDFAYRVDGGLGYGDHRLSQSDIPLVAGQIYDFSLDAWSESATAHAYATVNLVGSTSGTIKVMDKVRATADGVYETLSASFRPTTTETYTLQVYSEQGQHLWIDNLDLVESSTANLILNPSFENNTGPAQAGQPRGNEIGVAHFAGRPGETYWDWGYTDIPNWDRDPGYPVNTEKRIWLVTDSGAGATAEFPDGDFAYVADGGLGYGDHRLSQSGIPLAAGEQYNFSIDAWSESAGADAYITVDMVAAGSGNVLSLLDNVPVTADGAFETLTAILTPSETDLYMLQIYSQQGPHLWVDNLSLTAAVPEPSTLALAVMAMLGLGLGCRCLLPRAQPGRGSIDVV